MIETRLLRNALMLARHRNFARAAKALHISQPTLSRNIQQLEKIFGERLFDRSSKALLPTQAGEIMLKHARIIIATSKTMQQEIELHQGLFQGSISIGSGPYPASALLAPAIGRFSKDYPNIKIDISVDDWTKFPGRLMQEDFDFVVMESSQVNTSRDFELIPLNNHPGFFFCRWDHPLLKKINLTVSDLSQFPLIFTVLPKRLADILVRLFFPGKDADEVSVGKLQNISCNDLGTMKAMVFHSDSIGIATYGTLASELDSGLFVALPFHIPKLKSAYDIVKRKALSSSPAARKLIEILIETDDEQSVLEIDLIKSLGPEIQQS